MSRHSETGFQRQAPSDQAPKNINKNFMKDNDVELKIAQLEEINSEPLNDIDEEINKSIENVAQYLRSKCSVNAEKHRKEKADMESTIKSLKDDLKCLSDSNDGLNEELKKANVQIHGYQKNLASMKKDLDSNDTKIKRLEEEKKELEKTADSWKNQADSAQNKLSALEKEFGNKTAQLNKIIKELPCHFGKVLASIHDAATLIQDTEPRDKSYEGNNQRKRTLTQSNIERPPSKNVRKEKTSPAMENCYPKRY